MSRSGYSDDCDDQWQFALWRGTVKRSLRGKRGQTFLKELLSALDAMPEKKLVRNVLEVDGFAGRYEDAIIVGADSLVSEDGTVSAIGDVCAIGAVGRARGVDMSKLDPEDIETVAETFGISGAMAREIVYWNDEGSSRETPEARYQRMRAWVVNQITPSQDAATPPTLGDSVSPA